MPDYGIGAVLLTNSDTGGMLLRPFLRRLLEVVFDGKPEAAEDVDGRASRYKATMAKERERLIVPAGAEQVAKLAARYTSSALGDLAVRRQGAATIFDFGEWTAPSPRGKTMTELSPSSLSILRLTGWSLSSASAMAGAPW